MKTIFYGLSMGQMDNHVKSSTENYYTSILRRLIKEFECIDAELLQIANDNANMPTTNKVDALVAQGYFVFKLRQEVYFSDILKTTELVMEEVAGKIVNGSKFYKNEPERIQLLESFKVCFRPYCVEKEFFHDLPQEVIVETVKSELAQQVSMGRGIPLATKRSIVGLLFNHKWNRMSI